MTDEPEEQALPGDEEGEGVLTSLPQRRPQRPSSLRKHPAEAPKERVHEVSAGTGKRKEGTTFPRPAEEKPTSTGKGDGLASRPRALVELAADSAAGLVSTGLDLSSKAASILYKQLRR